jgi:transcriptional regulator with XRE-family HTH domain
MTKLTFAAMYFVPAQLFLVSPDEISSFSNQLTVAANQMMAKKSPNPTDKYVGSRVRMRRLMLSMSQEKLGERLGLTFQQVQKYEKGTNRIGASRLQQIAQILKVPVSFFFEGATGSKSDDGSSKAPVADYVSDFLSSSDGLALTKAFTNIKDSKLRRRVVDLVEEIAGEQR